MVGFAPGERLAPRSGRDSSGLGCRLAEWRQRTRRRATSKRSSRAVGECHTRSPRSCFPVLGLVLVVVAPTAAARWSALVYTVGVTAMYATSACYHRGHWSPPARRRLRRLDHSMILVGIAATYTPLAVVGLDTRSARILLGNRVAAGHHRDRRADVVAATRPAGWCAGIYVVVGWTALVFVPGAVEPARRGHLLAHRRRWSRLLASARRCTRRAGPIRCPRCSASTRCSTRSSISAGLDLLRGDRARDRGCVTVEQADVVIVGGGLLGLSTAWALRGRREVLVLERDTVGHARGGSHGPDADLPARLRRPAVRRDGAAGGGALARARGRGRRAAAAPDAAAHVRAGRRRGVPRARAQPAHRSSASPRPRSPSGSPRSRAGETRCWRRLRR